MHHDPKMQACIAACSACAQACEHCSDACLGHMPECARIYAAQTIKVEGVVNQAKHLIDVKKAYVKNGADWKEIKLDDEHHKMGGDEKKDDMGGMKMDGAKEHKH